MNIEQLLSNGVFAKGLNMYKNYNDRCQDLILDTLQRLAEAHMDKQVVHKVEAWFDALPHQTLINEFVYLPRISITFKE